MLLKEYKEKIKLKTIEEIPINKYINIRGKEVLILNITKYDGECKLWMVHKNTIKREEDNVFEFYTNRDDLVSTIKNSALHMNFRKMKLNNIEVNFESSHSGSVDYAYGNDLIIINYFIEKDYLDEKWDNIEIEDIRFSCYIQNKDENLPVINKDEEIKVLLELDEEYVEHLIQHPLKVSIGKFEEDNKIYYKDYDDKENYFYLDEIVKYDLWKETAKNINKNINNVAQELRETYKEDMMNGVKNTCPENMDYTAIYYENKENTQLRFLSKEYLNKKTIYGSSCTSMYWISENKEGINGYIQYTDGLAPVKKRF